MELKKYLKKRKRNAVTFILILIPFKAWIHFMFFDETYYSEWADQGDDPNDPDIFMDTYDEYLSQVLRFSGESFSAWILSIIILSLIVFAINDKIKAR
jgi:hypothetical protein